LGTIDDSEPRLVVLGRDNFLAMGDSEKYYITDCSMSRIHSLVARYFFGFIFPRSAPHPVIDDDPFGESLLRTS
jgi:hypothetical protein